MGTTKNSLLTRIMISGFTWFFKRQGWTVFNEVPDVRKCVVIAVPHTSNWDFVYIMGAKQLLRIPLSFVGKITLFRWPFGQMMREMGGVPVDRKKSSNFVEAMVSEFANREEFMLTIAPEGTRGKVKKWKTGFYHIAVGAKVPLVIGVMDYAKKTVGLAGAIMPTGDYAKDMEQVSAFYRTTTGRHPDQSTPDFGSIDLKE